jgi:hypothetical protein
MKKSIAFYAFLLILAFCSNKLFAQSHIYIGQAYGLEHKEKNLWISRVIMISDDQQKNLYIQAGEGYSGSARCIIQHTQVAALISALEKGLNMEVKAQQTRKNSSAHLATFDGLDLSFKATHDGQKGDVIMTVTDFEKPENSMTLYINSSHLRVFLIVLKEVKATYMKTPEQ